MAVDYTIISVPKYIQFTCPHCNYDMEQDFNDIDFRSDYWGDGGYITCAHCGQDVELDNYEYC